jgi:hypothetical protein
MAETNGYPRLDRIEATLDRMADGMARHREEFDSEIKQLLTAQVIVRSDMQNWWTQQKRNDAALDERVDKLVSVLSAFVGKLTEGPPNG